jgi:hypothetical protein
MGDGEITDQDIEMDETCRPWSILSASVSGLEREALAMWRRLQGDPARVPLHRSSAH